MTKVNGSITSLTTTEHCWSDS